MGGVPEECYAAPSLARWWGPASAREDSRSAHRALDGRAAALMPVVKGVSGSFGGIIEVRNARANRSSRAFSSRDRSRGWGRGWGRARAGGRWVRGRAGRRGSSRETRNEPRDAMERLTRGDSRAFDRRRVVYNPWTWSRRDYSWIRRDSTEASSIALRRFAPRRASGRFGRD